MKEIEEDILINDVVDKDLNVIKNSLLAKKFIIEEESNDFVIGKKLTIRGYNISIEFIKIKGTKYYRMLTRTKGADKEFKKLKDLINKGGK